MLNLITSLENRKILNSNTILNDAFNSNKIHLDIVAVNTGCDIADISTKYLNKCKCDGFQDDLAVKNRRVLKIRYEDYTVMSKRLSD